MIKQTLLTAGAALLLTAGGTTAKGDWYPSKFGKDDESGRSNLMTPDRVKEAAELIKEGKIISLARVFRQDAAVRSPRLRDPRHHWSLRRAARRQPGRSKMALYEG